MSPWLAAQGDSARAALLGPDCLNKFFAHVGQGLPQLDGPPVIPAYTLNKMFAAAGCHSGVTLDCYIGSTTSAWFAMPKPSVPAVPHPLAAFGRPGADAN